MWSEKDKAGNILGERGHVILHLPHLELAGAHYHILVSTVGQEGDGGPRAEGTEFNHMDVVLARHRVGGTAARVLLHCVCPGEAGFRSELPLLYIRGQIEDCIYRVWL